MVMKQLWCAAAALTIVAAGCGRGNGDDGKFPAGFEQRSDAEKISYLMEHASPDSVARYVCDASLGLVPGAKIDTFANALLFAYETYRGDSLTIFCDAFEQYSSNLPLDRKMKIYALAGKADPMGMGYQLGLEYVAKIKEKSMTADEVAAEIEAFKKACADDPETYTRFEKAFALALSLDDTPDLPQDIKRKFSHPND